MLFPWSRPALPADGSVIEDPDALWRASERALLLLFLIGRGLLAAGLGLKFGFDADAHLLIVRQISWSDINVPLLSSLYSYHPPVGFLLARIPMALGANSVLAVEIVSWIASLVAFLALRQTLAILRVLHRPEGIVLLYASCSLPMIVFMSRSVNLDVLILAEAAVVLLCSVRALWREDESIGRGAALWGLFLTLAVGMLTKYSALLLFFIPVLVALASPIRRRALGLAAYVCATALLVVFPYYYFRYYTQTRDWMPTTSDRVYDAVQQRGARRMRDNDRVGFLVDLFSPKNAGLRPEQRDLRTLRMADTWKDLWIRDVWLGPSPYWTMIVGRALSMAMAVLVPLGLLLGLLRLRGEGEWRRLGRVLYPFGALLAAASVAYVYRLPWAGSLTNKAIYVAPVAWLIGYALAQFAVRGRVAQILCVCATAALVAVTHLLPAY